MAIGLFHGNRALSCKSCSQSLPALIHDCSHCLFMRFMRAVMNESREAMRAVMNESREALRA